MIIEENISIEDTFEVGAKRTVDFPESLKVYLRNKFWSPDGFLSTA